MYESNTNTNTENRKAFQKWLSQIPDNAFVDYQKQFREDPKKFKVVISFEQRFYSFFILPTKTHETPTPQTANRTIHKDSKQKRLFRYDIIYHFVFWCQLLRTRTHKRLPHPTRKREIIHARTLSTTPAPCGFFIVYWLHYPPHPTNTPRTKHHTHRPPHPQPTTGAGLQKFYYLLEEPRTY